MWLTKRTPFLLSGLRYPSVAGVRKFFLQEVHVSLYIWLSSANGSFTHVHYWRAIHTWLVDHPCTGSYNRNRWWKSQCYNVYMKNLSGVLKIGKIALDSQWSKSCKKYIVTYLVSFCCTETDQTYQQIYLELYEVSLTVLLTPDRRRADKQVGVNIWMTGSWW